MQSQHHLYAASNQQAAAAYQNVAAATGYAGPANMNIQPQQAATQFNHVVMMPVNHGVPQPAAQTYAAGYPGRDGAAVMYGGQPAGMMLTAPPMQQGQRTAPIPHQVMFHLVTSQLVLVGIGIDLTLSQTSKTWTYDYTEWK